jgi:hypothetical protein
MRRRDRNDQSLGSLLDARGVVAGRANSPRIALHKTLVPSQQDCSPDCSRASRSSTADTPAGSCAGVRYRTDKRKVPPIACTRKGEER